jgi:thiol:disulfide interchange protein DsbD
MKSFLLICSFIFYGLQLNAQSNPVKWTFTSKKQTSNTYEVYLNASIDDPWHIYSQSTPSGGPLPTKISYSVNPLVSISGTTAEDGSSKTIHDKNFGVDVKYYSKGVRFVQTVKLKSPVKTTLNGTIEYMICNDSKCLPPVTIPFNVILN